MKKFLLFIVEGRNDEIEIRTILRAACGNAFSDNYVDEYLPQKGDLTTESKGSEKTIVQRLNKIVISWRKGGAHPFQRIAPSDVKKIIHVVDTDGAFIPESSIFETDDEKAQYNDESIRHHIREQIIGRNRKKASIIRKLLETKQIDNIPYELYYASCNMDHLLFNERNMERNDKGESAFDFSRKCNCKEYLRESIYSEDIGAPGSYSESWEMIQQGHNSLKRCTNLNLLLDDIIESAK